MPKKVFIAAITVIVAATAAKAECLDMTVADYDEWEKSVEVCASEDGWLLEAPQRLPYLFKMGLTPLQAYEEDEIDRFDRENLEEQWALED